VKLAVETHIMPSILEPSVRVMEEVEHNGHNRAKVEFSQYRPLFTANMCHAMGN
jgi:hypothetical protein